MKKSVVLAVLGWFLLVGVVGAQTPITQWAATQSVGTGATGVPDGAICYAAFHATHWYNNTGSPLTSVFGFGQSVDPTEVQLVFRLTGGTYDIPSVTVIDDAGGRYTVATNVQATSCGQSVSVTFAALGVAAHQVEVVLASGSALDAVALVGGDLPTPTPSPTPTITLTPTVTPTPTNTVTPIPIFMLVTATPDPGSLLLGAALTDTITHTAVISDLVVGGFAPTSGAAVFGVDAGAEGLFGGQWGVISTNPLIIRLPTYGKSLTIFLSLAALFVVYLIVRLIVRISPF